VEGFEMTSDFKILIVGDLLTFGLGLGLIMTQPYGGLLSTLGEILVIAGVGWTVMFLFLVTGFLNWCWCGSIK
jgi:hypothetical protein